MAPQVVTEKLNTNYKPQTVTPKDSNSSKYRESYLQKQSIKPSSNGSNHDRAKRSKNVDAEFDIVLKPPINYNNNSKNKIQEVEELPDELYNKTNDELNNDLNKNNYRGSGNMNYYLQKQ